MRYEKNEITVQGQLEGPAVLTSYLLDRISVDEEKSRPAVIVCPGGGYRNRSDRESEPVVMQFLSMGYHAFLLDYSVAPNRFPTSLLELAEAVALVRENSQAWQVDPQQIYVCGFSAGGHLVCSLGVFWNQERVYGAIGRPAEQVRPDGLILCYPVITSGEFAHEGSFLQLLGEGAAKEQREAVSLERHAGSHMPKTFLWHTYEDETVPLENSLLLASAMKRHGVNFELHIYPRGGHGLSLANEETSGELRQELLIPACQNWISLAHTWIEGWRK